MQYHDLRGASDSHHGFFLASSKFAFHFYFFVVVVVVVVVVVGCVWFCCRARVIHSYFRHPRPRHHRDVYLLKTGILLFMHYHHDRFGAHTSSVAPWVKLSRMTSSPTPPTHEIAKGSSMPLDDITAMSPCAKIEFETILKILSL